MPTDPTVAVPIRLPRQLSIEGARREFDYQVGEIAYWPPSNEIAIFAGNDFELTIEPLD